VATWPPQLGLLYDDALRIVSPRLQVDSDQKARLLQDALRVYGGFRPDVDARYFIIASGSRSDALTAEILAAVHVTRNGAILGAEWPVGEVPPRYFGKKGIGWDTYPEGARVPSELHWIGRVPTATEEVQVFVKTLHYFQLGTPDAPTITGVAGANSWIYAIAARDDYGSTAAGETTEFLSTAAVAADLAGANAHVITWPRVRGARSYDVWLTDAPGVVATGLVTNVTTNTYTHASGAGSGATAPTANTTESGAPEDDWPAIIAKAGDLTCDELMSFGRDVIPDAFGGAPKDWQKIFDNAALQQLRFRERWTSIMFPTSPAGGAGSQGVLACTEIDHDSYLRPVFEYLRDDYTER